MEERVPVRLARIEQNLEQLTKTIEEFRRDLWGNGHVGVLSEHTARLSSLEHFRTRLIVALVATIVLVNFLSGSGFLSIAEVLRHVK